MELPSEKIVDLEEYRRRSSAFKPTPPERSRPTDPIIREMAYHLMMAIHCAKKLL